MLVAMNARSWSLLLILAALWGASYLFIKVSLEDLSPAMIVWARLALAALILVPVALARRALGGLRERMGWILVLAVVQIAGPFVLITAGEQHISSSLTGILVASAPIFTALLAFWVDSEERSSGWRAVGVGVGIVGVAVLLGVDVGGDSAGLLGGLMVLLASMGYAIGGFVIKRRFAGVQPLGMVAAAMAASALMMLVPALLSFPGSPPSATVTASIIALGVGGTGIAFVIFYTLIAGVGPARASIVAYVAPGFAIVYGVVLLGESFTLGTLAGLVLVLAGSWLAAGGRLRAGLRAQQQAAGA
jgi:drug/metabolite transporter (DMT)-like permease